MRFKSREAADRTTTSMGYWELDWAVGVPIIVVNVVVHVFGLGLIAGFVARMAVKRPLHYREFLRFVWLITVATLLATSLLAIEGLSWAGCYLFLGSIGDYTSAVLYSLNAITSYGHDNQILEKRWQLLGAMEAVNGMILFGLTTAFLFAMVQRFRLEHI
jgi:hypothetical protein